MTSGITGEKKDIVGQLAEKFIRGKGIEIGAVPRGFPVPSGVCLRRVDEYSLAMDDGGTGTGDKTLANLDFCIASHIIQNAGDPLTFLHRYLQTLRPGGILFVLVPCTSDSVVHLPALKRALLSSICDSSANVPEACISKSRKGEKILTLPVRIQWQGDCIIAGSQRYVFVIERFDYFEQIEGLLQKTVASPKNQTRPVDVIIPAYNAYDDLLRCLYSVMIHHENERIILIDDNSTDPRIGSLFSLLDPYQSSSLILTRQEKNRGFAATVNGGMQYSRNDVILLNSDTIVTKGWIRKLQDGVRSRENCGTMTPLSNNGTLCSVPVMMENNLLLPGASIDDYADMVEKISFRQFPAIPAGIGFCLYITRACLDTTGYFDEVTYQAGYGEETDFCLKAKKAGFTHQVSDTTFIYHRGMASFSGQAMRRLQEGIAALNTRHPSYQDEVSRFIQDNPLRGIQENIACRAVTWDFSGRSPRVLFIPDYENRIDCNQQAEEYGDNEVYYTLRCTQSEFFLSEYNHGNHLNYTFPADARSPETASDNIEKILCSFRISCICMDHPDPRINLIAEKIHIPCLISSFSSGDAPNKAKGTARAQFRTPGDSCVSEFPDEQATRSPLRERQEPDWSSGMRFTSAEIFHGIRAFPEARFKGVIPFRPESPGSLPARFLRCLSENGILYTLQRIWFFIIQKNEDDR
ncbi:MAG: glycosyltransferase [Methanoregula sp.]|jgi:GT2 family glycosyltransferase